MKRTALFISPHLDDVAFSCGGTLIKLARAGWHTRLCTIFTASVPSPRGFALACQTDKGLPPEVDYMELRRGEDEAFAAHAGVNVVTHLDFREAPHRGYESAAELFGGVRADDEVWRAVVPELRRLVGETTPELIFAPQGLGDHVDHEQTIRAVLALDADARLLWYRDTPYAIRDACARRSPLLPVNPLVTWCDITSTLAAKTTCIEAYATQLGFQFGGTENMRASLRNFHQAEARRVNMGGAVECFLGLENRSPFVRS